MDDKNLAKIINHPGYRISQLVVGVVFILNISCAVAFIFRPERYMGGFEIGGLQGRVLTRAMGILFLMWNVTYPLVILNPYRHKTLFAVILIQQAIGLLGESWLMLTLPAGHAPLQATGLRFIFFDGAGLILMGAAYFVFIKQPIRSFDKPYQ